MAQPTVPCATRCCGRCSTADVSGRGPTSYDTTSQIHIIALADQQHLEQDRAIATARGRFGVAGISVASRPLHNSAARLEGCPFRLLASVRVGRTAPNRPADEVDAAIAFRTPGGQTSLVVDVRESDRVAAGIDDVLRSLKGRGRVSARAKELFDEIATGLAQSSPVETNLSAEAWVEVQKEARSAIVRLEKSPNAMRRTRGALRLLKYRFEEAAKPGKSPVGLPGRKHDLDSLRGIAAQVVGSERLLMLNAWYGSEWRGPGSYRLVIVSDQRIAEARLKRGEAVPEVVWSIQHDEITSLTSTGQSDTRARNVTLKGTKMEVFRFPVGCKEEEQALIAIWEQHRPSGF
jgi:hypothetical protein